MTAQDIEKLFQDELGIYEFVEHTIYNEDTKELHMVIKMDFSREYSKENPLFYDEVFMRVSFDEEVSLRQNMPNMIFVIDNNRVTTEIGSLAELKWYEVTKKIFEDYLYKWNVL